MPETQSKFHVGERVVFFREDSPYGYNIGTVEVVEEDDGVFTYTIVFGDDTTLSAKEEELEEPS
ncbi:MAG: hypothetical protein ABH880_00855 [Patescibacteria group bacterium]